MGEINTYKIKMTNGETIELDNRMPPREFLESISKAEIHVQNAGDKFEIAIFRDKILYITMKGEDKAWK